jgi:hypothetical protein
MHRGLGCAANSTHCGGVVVVVGGVGAMVMFDSVVSEGQQLDRRQQHTLHAMLWQQLGVQLAVSLLAGPDHHKMASALGCSNHAA